jgi:hypothetical protein
VVHEISTCYTSRPGGANGSPGLPWQGTGATVEALFKKLFKPRTASFRLWAQAKPAPGITARNPIGPRGADHTAVCRRPRHSSVHLLRRRSIGDRIPVRLSTALQRLKCFNPSDEANLPSGGKATDIEIDVFLSGGRRHPEHQALLRLMGPWSKPTPRALRGESGEARYPDATEAKEATAAQIPSGRSNIRIKGAAQPSRGGHASAVSALNWREKTGGWSCQTPQPQHRNRLDLEGFSGRGPVTRSATAGATPSLAQPRPGPRASRGGDGRAQAGPEWREAQTSAEKRCCLGASCPLCAC